MTNTNYTYCGKIISYTILSNGYEIYLGNNVTPLLFQIEPNIPNPELSYEQNCIQQIKEMVGIPVTNTLDELKQVKINESKKNLRNYLAQLTIKSSCHGNVEKQYSVTEEKQNYLTKEILLSTLALQSDEDYQPSWNATGEQCTSDWTLDELKTLAFEISTTVKPLVSLQQQMEETINSATTEEEVNNINITFTKEV